MCAFWRARRNRSRRISRRVRRQRRVKRYSTVKGSKARRRRAPCKRAGSHTLRKAAAGKKHAVFTSSEKRKRVTLRFHVARAASRARGAPLRRNFTRRQLRCASFKSRQFPSKVPLSSFHNWRQEHRNVKWCNNSSRNVGTVCVVRTRRYCYFP